MDRDLVKQFGGISLSSSIATLDGIAVGGLQSILKMIFRQGETIMAGVIGCGFLVFLAVVALFAERFLSAPVALLIGFVVGIACGMSIERKNASSPKPYDPADHSFEDNVALDQWIESEHKKGNL